MNSMSLKLTINFLEFGGYPMEFNDGDFLGEFVAWVDVSYGGSLFASLWTFSRVYSIQMPQTHCKIINLTKIFMD
jgi:hypothetical protein